MDRDRQGLGCRSEPKAVSNVEAAFLLQERLKTLNLRHIVKQSDRWSLRASATSINITTSLVDHARSASPSALTSLTKGGLAAVVRSLAIEYAARGVRVNAAALGVIKRRRTTPPTKQRRPFTPSAAQARSTTSSTGSSTSSRRGSPPERPCTSTVVRPPDTEKGVAPFQRVRFPPG
jgi:NAD(P)-dependent dehydrogenase (short-subunit alcohol dehydrogenase family)